MNQYDQLEALLNEVMKCSQEEREELEMCRMELADFHERHGKMGAMALLMIAAHMAIQMKEKQEQAQ